MINENLKYFVQAVMTDFPSSVRDFTRQLASPHTPAMDMSQDERRYKLVPQSLAHLGISDMGLDRGFHSEILMDDKVHVIWLKMDDPEQALDNLLLSIRDISVNDAERDERYYALKSCIANLAYFPDGTAMLALIAANRESMDYYIESTGCPLNPSVKNIVGEILA